MKSFKQRLIAVFLGITFSALLILPRVQNFVSENEQNETIPEKIRLVYGEDEEVKAEAQDRPDQALLYEKIMRSEIGKPFSYPANWRFAALQQARRMPRLFKAGEQNWQERGPANIGGRTRAIVVHPQNPNIWWLGSVGGGIWKTEDAGEHWRPVTDDMPALAISTIDICRSKPDILYAGTGEGIGNYDAIVGDGIFKSTDGGEHWIQLPATAGQYDFRYVNRLVVHPQHPDTVLAATNTGILRTFDGGQTWSLRKSGKSLQIVANPKNFNTLFAMFGANGIYKSTDLGAHWRYVSQGISNNKRIELAVSPSDTNFVYATAANSNGGVQGFYQSKNGGQTWQNLGSSTNWLGTQGWYDNTLVVHPFDSTIVFVGGLDLYQLQIEDGSMHAVQLTYWFGGSELPYAHADHHFLATIPAKDSSFALLDANDGGIFYSPDGGLNWQSKDNGYNVTQYYDGARHPFLSQYIGGSQDNGTSLSPVDPDAQSTWRQVIGGDGFDCAWDKFDPYNVYATLYDSRIYKSTDGGLHFSPINNGLPQSNIFHTPLFMDPFNPQKLFTVSDANKIYITYNGGQSWQNFPVDLNGARWVRIAVSQADSSIVWIASSSDHINVSTDGGKTFHTVTKPDNAPNGYVTGIATNPKDSAEALVMFGVYGYGKVFRTHDLGRSWQDITNNLPEIPVHCAVYMPYDTTKIWLGTDLGLFISDDNGQSWQFADGALPAVSVRRLKIVNKEIVAVTHGRGIWSLHDDQLPELVVPPLPPELQTVFPPNPLTKTMKILFRTLTPYDSLHVDVNDEPLKRMGALPAYVDTFATIPVEPPDYLEIKVVGFKDGQPFASRATDQLIYEPIDSLKERFNGGSSDFYGDLFIDQPGGFKSPALQTPHPYSDQRDYIALLGSPVRIGKKYRITYKDIALVEPGEPGHYYPDQQMWDYVTVEGSLDGENWQILIPPYDCRFNSQWKSYYDNSSNPNNNLFVKHTIDLNDYFTEGQIVYIRFRLHADPYTNGWGWIIDDVTIKPENTTGIADRRSPEKFQVFDNYPNPFNPSTTIAFTLDRNEAVTLKIYNANGQLVRTLLNNKLLYKGNRYRFLWQGRNNIGNPVASGVYFFKLITPKHSVVKKMILLK